MAASSNWRTFHGYIQWDPEYNDHNGTKYAWVNIQVPGASGEEIRVTLWDDMLAILPDINKGDYLVIQGPYEEKPGPNGRTYRNLTGKRVCHNGTGPFSNIGMGAAVKGSKPTAKKAASSKVSEDDLF